MNSKQKGAITELAVMTRLAKKEIPVSVPFGDNSRYDLVIEINDKLERVQCKTARLSRNENAIEFSTCSTYGHVDGKMKNDQRKTYDGEVEWFGVHCIEIDKTYLIPFESVKNCKSVATLRLNESKNNQAKNVRVAKKYEI